MIGIWRKIFQYLIATDEAVSPEVPGIPGEEEEVTGRENQPFDRYTAPTKV